MPPLPHDYAVPDNDTTNRGIGGGPANPPPRQGDRPSHHLFVKILPFIYSQFIDALETSSCHARMTLSGIHFFNNLQAGFPIKIASGMTTWTPSIYWKKASYLCSKSWSSAINSLISLKDR